MSPFITELQTFSPIPVMHRYLSGDPWTLEMHENYNKGSFRNRYQLAGPNGPVALSIPLKSGKNNKVSVKKVEISYDENWPQQHLRTIQTCYGKSPFFDEYFPGLEQFFSIRPEFLMEFNLKALELVHLFLGISGFPRFSSTYKTNAEYFELGIQDCRDYYLPGHLLQEVKQTVFYNQVFEEKNGFLANLSILDLLFCLGPEARIKLAGG